MTKYINLKIKISILKVKEKELKICFYADFSAKAINNEQLKNGKEQGTNNLEVIYDIGAV